MFSNVTCVQAYKIIFHFLDTIYFTTYDDNLGSILGGMALYSDISGEEPKTMDPANFGEWMNSVKMVIDDDTITYESQITIEQMNISIYQYFVTYCNKGAEPSIRKIRDFLGEDFDYSDVTKWLKVKWLKSIEHVLQEVSIEKIGHLFGGTTRLTHHESFFIMQMFLDNFCQRNDNFDLIQLVKDSRLKDRSDIYRGISDFIEPKIWSVWHHATEVAVEQEENKTLNLLSAYKAVPIFLISYFGDDKSSFIDKVIQKFEIDQDNKPINFSYWSSWTSAAVKLNAQQMELMNNLISINTSISHEVALKIIQAWMKYYQNLIGADVVQRILADNQGMQQIVDEIKKQQRSYLLLDSEVTVLETYHIMIKLLELHGKEILEFTVDEKGKPVDFEILLDWIRICEQVAKD